MVGTESGPTMKPLEGTPGVEVVGQSSGESLRVLSRG